MYMKSWLDLTEEQRKKYIDEFDKKSPNTEWEYTIGGWFVFIALTIAGLIVQSLALILISIGIFFGIICYFSYIGYKKERENEFVKWLAVSKKVIK